MIEWFARNPVAANLLMVTIIVAGLLSASRSIPLEIFPSFENDTVTVVTAFRGATPHSVEDGLTTRIEESIYDLEGIETIRAQSAEGVSMVVAEVAEGYDKRQILNDIKLRVDALNTLPAAAERPVVSLSSYNPGVIQIAVMGDVGEKNLRLAADQVRQDLLAKPGITLVDLLGVADYEISVEITPAVLDSYNLSLAGVAAAIQQGSVDVSAGNVKTRDGDILVRTDGQAYTRNEFAKIPVVTRFGADPILLGDIATIVDGFEQQPLLTTFNNKPAIMVDVLRTGDQSSIQIAKTVRDYIEVKNTSSVDGITLAYWDDDSKILKARLTTLLKSGVQGGILVLLLLSLFLRPAIAFWVFLGVPVAFMGAFIFMPFVGGTFNIISLFAFITVLGIVVDDAIVTGENIYRKMRGGMDSLEASIVGTKQIAIPVTFGILTTVVAFYPMSDLGANRIGYIAAQIPMVVIPVLLFSLIESKLVLPSHLSHINPRPEGAGLNWLSRTQMSIARGFEESIIRYYQPFLKKCLHNKLITIVCLLAASSIIMAIATSGHLKFTFFPRVESEHIRISLTMPDTTGFETTDQHIKNFARHFSAMQEKYRDPETGRSIITHIYTTTGSSGAIIKPSVGSANIELIGPEERHIDIKASDLAREIRELVGEIPGAEKLTVIAEIGRGGEPINVELSGVDIKSMAEVGSRLRDRLKQYPGVFDIQDNFSGGKEELDITLNAKAHALGLTLADVANQIRASVFGFEAQRIQRGREEVRVMVRLPLQYRSSVDDLQNLPIRIGPQNKPVPLSDLAQVVASRSATTLHRIDRSAVINITADVDKEKTNVPAVIRDLESFLADQTLSYPNLNYSFKGEAEEQSENNAGFQSGLVLVLIVIYTLLAIPFKSYAQPLIVMSIIPFSAVGAILGHVIVGYDLSILSLVGMMALLGVVVNDSLVLVDYINQQRRKGVAVFDAVLTSGTTRFRPVILTSLTTFAGLTPLLLDGSTQAEFLKQMAISLGFGILFATAITLIIVPVNYLLGYQIKHGCKRLAGRGWDTWLEYWHREDSPAN
ncbi:MAG: efflux RND transporter permease subunit [Gammaproteobacteria bacterium]|nr:efflux RND transporter permease subunit [Gammaproteobacteria bacterium]